MQGAGWINLFRRIPQEHHDSLVLMTTNGSEIVIQSLLRLEHDYLAAVGRLAGSTDQGKVLIIPYDQLTYLALSKKLSETEMQTLLGGTVEAKAPSPASAEVSAGTGPRIPAAESDTRLQATGHGATQATSKNGPPSKSMLLARLRQRLADDAAKQTSVR